MRGAEISPEHYLRLILHRWWLVASTFVVVTGSTVIATSQMPDIFTSYTTILVDPQKVPETYVRPTVTGDVRNRLGTLSQQILSATRLQRIIDTLNLYPEERKTLAREDVITKMRADIAVSMLGNGEQDLEAFRITYSGQEPRLVAQVTNQMASLFIEENLKAREQQSTGTTEFLANQLQESRRELEAQEAKLKDFKLKHIGEMPEQQNADLQVLGQLQSQVQIESEALSRGEQQRTYLQSMMAQGAGAPVIDLDDPEPAVSPQAAATGQSATARKLLETEKATLAALLEHGYTERHPDVQRIKAQIAFDEAALARPKPGVADAPAPEAQAPVKSPRPTPAVPLNYLNPVLESQLRSVQDEIAKDKQELGRLHKTVAGYQEKLEAIPVREQQIAELVRDYEISKAHYTNLLSNQLSAETATQLEVRQKGEKFTVLDPAQPAERPSKPNRLVLNSGGAVVGLGLGLLLAVVTEFLGMTITSAEQITATCGLTVLEVIPIIETRADRRKRRIIMAAASGAVVTMLATVAVLFFYYRGQTF